MDSSPAVVDFAPVAGVGVESAPLDRAAGIGARVILTALQRRTRLPPGEVSADESPAIAEGVRVLVAEIVIEPEFRGRAADAGTGEAAVTPAGPQTQYLIGGTAGDWRGVPRAQVLVVPCASRCVPRAVASPTVPSWNQIIGWLRALDSIRAAAGSGGPGRRSRAAAGRGAGVVRLAAPPLAVARSLADPNRDPGP